MTVRITNFWKRLADNKFIGTVFWTMIDKISFIVGSFILLIVLANGSTPALVGEFAFGLSILWILSPFVHLGTENIVTRLSVNAPSHEQIAVENALAATFTAAFIVIGLVSVAAIALLDTALSRQLVIILSLRVFLFASYPVAGWLQANYSMQIFVKPKATITLLGTIAAVSIFLITNNILHAAMIMAAEAMLIAAIVIGIMLRRRWSVLSIQWAQVMLIIREAWPLMAASVSVVLYSKVDQVMLRVLAGASETGYYAIAARLSEGFGFAAAAVAQSMLPILVAELRENDRAAILQSLQAKVDLMALIGYCVIVLWILVGPWVIHTLFGPAYGPAVPILMVHLASFLFVCMGSIQNKWLIAYGLHRYVMLVTMVGLLTNIVLNSVLIPLHGGVGAAIATVISYMMASYGMGWVIVSLRPLFRRQTKALILPIRMWSAVAGIRRLVIQDMRIVKVFSR